MALAYRKQFQKAGFQRFDTSVAIVWAKFLDDDNTVVVASELRDGLSDHRPQEEDEPCIYYLFADCSVHKEGTADNPLMALTAASEITV